MRRTDWTRVVVLVVSGLVAACGNSATGGQPHGSPCVGGTDLDGDGYGIGCPSGPDCNDMDPTMHTGCTTCQAGAAYPGCPCTPGEPDQSCFDGTSDQLSHPPCAKGTTTCDPTSKSWGACLGETIPVAETCDGIDNDCDGTIDNGVLSACGTCEPGCDHNPQGGTPFPLPGTNPLPTGVAGVGANGVSLDPNGDLVLNQTAISFHFIWVANDKEGTVSKLDTSTGKEVARYASVTHKTVVDDSGVGAAALPTWNQDNNGDGYADDRPSRTAVDFFGDVWVANRAFGFQPSATKIYNDPVDCKDKNGNGKIDTSSDVNGDGVISLNDPAEFLGEDDECIAFSVIVGPNDGLARAAAIDAGGIDPGSAGNVWIGMYNEQAFYQLNGKTGALIKRVPVPGTSPYGAAIDSKGNLWAPNGCCGATTLVQVDTASGSIVSHSSQEAGVSCGGSYGIAIDLKDRVWLGAYSCASALRFDPGTGAWAEAQVPGLFGAGWGARGIGADANGNMWIALHTTNMDNHGQLGRIDADSATSTGLYDLNALTQPGTTVGVPVGAAVDFDGAVWTVNQNTSNASRLYIDPVTKQPAPHPVTGHMVDTFPVGANPYTYSDFTGFGLRNITKPSGDYDAILAGCANGDKAHWEKVTWDATVPPGTSVEIYARVGDDPATIAGQPQYGPWTVSPADLQMAPGPVPDGKFLDLTIRLISLDRASSPIVKAYDVQWACPQVPIN